MIELNPEWTDLMRRYEADHSDPRNQACHKVGIPLIAASFPVGATVIGLPLAATMFTVGWGFQLVGHFFEGKPPSFVSDKRNLAVGLLWWLKKSGAPLKLADAAR
ncbi:MAG: Mpo1-like protein [Polyangiales bacterium]